MKKTGWMSDEEYKLITQKTPIPCVDLVILRKNGKLEVLLLKRKTGYEKGKWCIIGGRKQKGEISVNAISRHVSDLGIKVSVIAPFEVGFPAWVNDNPKQDKTKHSVAEVYPVKIIKGEIKEEGEEYLGFKWFPINKLPSMAFDHKFDVLKVVEQLKKFGTNF